MRSAGEIHQQPPKLQKELRALIILACLFAPVAVLTIAARSSSSTHSAIPTAETVPPMDESTKVESNSSLVAPPADGDIQSEARIDFESSQTSSGQSPNTKLWVNNQPVEIPHNGSTHKVMTNDNSTTTIDISNSSSMTSGSSSSSTNVEINTDSATITETDPGP